MEKKETSTQNPPLSVCEKLFNVFSVHNSAFRPIRRLTFKSQEPATATAAPPAPNLSPPKKPQVNVVDNEKKPSHHLDLSSSFPPKTELPKKPSYDVPQVQTPSKVEIKNISPAAPKEEIKKQEIVPGHKVPVNPPPETRKPPNRSSTRREETPPVPLPVSLPAAPPPPKVEVAPVQALQLPKPAPPPAAPAKVSTEVRRQPQRTETKNIDGKADDYISRIRNKLRSNSAAEKTTSTN